MGGILCGQKPIPMEEQYKLVLECRQSGLSDYHWCLEHDIKPGTFYNWVKRLRKAGTYTIPAPAGRDTYTAMPRQDIVKVELVEESVKIPRHGYPPAAIRSISMGSRIPWNSISAVPVFW